MTAKNTNTTAKAATQKTAAERKADEVAAMMGDDVEASAPAKPTAPPAVKATDKTDTETKEKSPEQNEDQAKKDDQTNVQGDDELDDQDNDLDTDEIESDDQDEDQISGYVQAKVGHMVILSKTVHTKDADGKDVQFIASKKPQNLGEYAAMAIAAGCAKPHKAG